MNTKIHYQLLPFPPYRYASENEIKITDTRIIEDRRYRNNC